MEERGGRARGPHLPQHQPPGSASAVFDQLSSTFRSPPVLCVDNVLKSLTNLLQRNKMVVTGSLCHLRRGTGEAVTLPVFRVSRGWGKALCAHQTSQPRPRRASGWFHRLVTSVGLVKGPDGCGSFRSLLWVTVHTPCRKPILSPPLAHLGVAKPDRLLIHLNCPSSRNPKPLRLETCRLLQSVRGSARGPARVWGGRGCRLALGRGAASQQAVLWVCSPSPATGPPEGGQWGGCPERGPWRQRRPLRPSPTPLPGGLSRPAAVSTAPGSASGHRSDVKLLPSSFCCFFSKIIFYREIFQIRGVLKRIILTLILLLLSLLAHGWVHTVNTRRWTVPRGPRWAQPPPRAPPAGSSSPAKAPGRAGCLPPSLPPPAGVPGCDLGPGCGRGRPFRHGIIRSRFLGTKGVFNKIIFVSGFLTRKETVTLNFNTNF